MSNINREKMLALGIQIKRIEIEKQIMELENELDILRSFCPHPNVEKQYHSDSGNYDPGQDREWYTYECPDCGKRWTEDLD